MNGMFYSEYEIRLRIAGKTMTNVVLHPIKEGDDMICFTSNGEHTELTMEEFSERFGLPHCICVEGGVMSFSSKTDMEYYHG